jgi:membrane-bound lytic murein transglycosylase F
LTGGKRSFLVRPYLFFLSIAILLLAWIISFTPVTGPALAPDNAGPAITRIAGTSPLPEPAFHSPDHARVLRLLVRAGYEHGERLPEQELRLIRRFAKETGRHTVWQDYDSPRQLQKLLSSGTENVVLTPGLPGQEGASQILNTIPWGLSRQQVVVREDTTAMHGITDLTTRQVYIKRSSPAWPTLKALAASYTAMDIQVIPETMATSTVLERVASGQYDVAVLDSLLLDAQLKNYLDLGVAFNLTDDEPLTWAVAPEARNLHAALNQFLNRTRLAMDVAEVYRGDLYTLKARKKLRLITSRGPGNYFYHNGHLAGFEYEFLKRFARNNGMRLEVVVANTPAEMLDQLLTGKGDVIGAAVPAGSLPGGKGIRYTRPYNFAAPIVVGRTHDYPLLDARDLEGRYIVLPEESPYMFELGYLRSRGIHFKIIKARPGMNTFKTLALVARGDYDLTVIGSQQINTDLVKHMNLKVHFSLDEPLPQAWVVRDADKQLLTALNAYIDREYRMAFYNVLYAKYIDKPDNLSGHYADLAGVNRLSPYDDIVHEYAEKYGFDWRLIVAQMYMESQFNPHALSDAGARGLMQLLPETASLLGIENLSDPGRNIYGGIRYLDYLRRRFDQGISPEDRTWFTLAAYNAGYNRVKRARRLAASMGLDADRWFNHVEKAMLILSKPYTKNGDIVRYCRCGQTASYVRDIKTLYNNYVRLTRPAYVPVSLDEGGSGG